MRTLLYADWSVAKGDALRSVAARLLVLMPLVLMSNDEMPVSPAVIAAPIFVSMTLFAICLDLFGVDEVNGWEQVRLALPTTARQVVRARYASMALTTLVAAVAGFATGRIAEELSRVTTSAVVPHGGIEAVQAAFAAGLGVLAYLALLMPLIFRMGMRRARPFFMLPFPAMLFLNVSGVRDAVVSVVSLLKDLVSSLGPAPLLAAAAVGTAALYVLSMLVSERLYASREL